MHQGFKAFFVQRWKWEQLQHSCGEPAADVISAGTGADKRNSYGCGSGTLLLLLLLLEADLQKPLCGLVELARTAGSMRRKKCAYKASKAHAAVCRFENATGTMG